MAREVDNFVQIEGTPWKLALLKRRVEMLDDVTKGFHLSTVIAQLAQKYKVPESCLYKDWERRGQWMPIVMGIDKYAEFTDVIENKLNAVQRAAWSLYMRADNDSARVGALKVVLDSLEIYSNTVLSKQVLERLERVEQLAEKKEKEERKR